MKTSLKDLGLKVTQPRILILKLLEESEKRHFSTNEIYDLLIKEGHRLTLGTIYRVLDQFEKSGVVMSHNFTSNNVIYELTDVDHHDHMIDSKSGAIVEFYDEIIEQRQREIAKKHGFTLLEHRLVLYGEFEAK